MWTVTISRQRGSLGTGIAQGVAGKFKHEYVGKKKVTEAFSPYGFFISEVEKFDERKPSFGDSLHMQKKKFIHIFVDQAVLGMAGDKNEKHPAYF
jgi:hypothetical protein